MYERPFLSQEQDEKLERKTNQEAELSIRDKLIFPHVDAVLSLIDKEFKNGEGEKIDREAVKDILWEFIDQRINRAAVYSSEKHKAAFPYGVTDTAELAKKLYGRYAGNEVNSDQLQKNNTKKRKEFIF